MSSTGRGWAYLGAILGGAASIAANVAHSYVPPSDSAPGWQPQPGAVVTAVFWPVALFVAIEILARVQWPTGWRWSALRLLGLLPVAMVAAIVSYRHLSGLLAWYREDAVTVAIGPLAVDGLMVMATGALIATGAGRRRAHTAQEAVLPAQDEVSARAGDDLCGDEGPTAGLLVDEPTGPVAPRAAQEPVQAVDQGEHASTQTAQEAAQTTDMPAQDSAQVEADEAPPWPDEVLLERFGVQLHREHEKKPLSRYRVEQVTGSKSRQAERLRVQIAELSALADELVGALPAQAAQEES